MFIHSAPPRCARAKQSKSNLSSRSHAYRPLTVLAIHTPTASHTCPLLLLIHPLCHILPFLPTMPVQFSFCTTSPAT